MLNVRLAPRQGRRGFTLIELMIVVAILGLLAAMAIPNFLRYQARSRRSEAFANLVGLARAQKGHYAERNNFLSSDLPFPDPAVHNAVHGGTLGPWQMPWDAASETAFADSGWRPEGEVYYSYGSYTGTSVGATGCGGCETCWTAVATGDVDGDTSTTHIMYVHPTIQGGVTLACADAITGVGTPVNAGGSPIYDEVAARDQSEY
jgi:type IV pilus assembly protein PilA